MAAKGLMFRCGHPIMVLIVGSCKGLEAAAKALHLSDIVQVETVADISLTNS